MDAKTKEAIDRITGLSSLSTQQMRQAEELKKMVIKDALDALQALGMSEQETRVVVTQHFNQSTENTIF